MKSLHAHAETLVSKDFWRNLRLLYKVTEPLWGFILSPSLHIYDEPQTEDVHLRTCVIMSVLTFVSVTINTATSHAPNLSYFFEPPSLVAEGRVLRAKPAPSFQRGSPEITRGASVFCEGWGSRWEPRPPGPWKDPGRASTQVNLVPAQWWPT